MPAHDLHAEPPLLPLSRARLLLVGRSGGPPDIGTVRAWVTRGVTTPAGVVRLQAVSVGLVWMTTAAALARFEEAVTAARTATADPLPTRTPVERQRAAAKATATLKAAGW